MDSLPPSRRSPRCAAAVRLAFVLAAAVLALVQTAPGKGPRGSRCRPACCPGVDLAPETPAPAPEDAIRAVLAAQVEAWNKGDLEAFMQGYWASPELTFFSAANRTQGWQGTLDRYRKRYQSEGQEMGKLTFSDLQVEVLGPDAAFVRGRWQLERSKDRPGGLFTLIFKRFPEGWRIVHDHTSS
jgi:ketosteroid isomerase-like protein